MSSLPNEATTPFWSSENDIDQAELIVRRILYGLRLKIHYIMVAIVISLIFLGLMFLVFFGLCTLFSVTQNKISSYQEILKDKKLFKRKKLTKKPTKF